MNVLTIIGARPQFIKAATVSRNIKDTTGINETVVHTGQHFDANMSAIFFEELDMAIPKYNLGIYGGNHGEQTGRMLIAIETILINESPDIVLLYGDTNSTLAGSLAASKLHIPIAHVEAGLRSFNKKMPEEINRILTDHSSDLLFAPTIVAVKNLQNEGVDEQKIFNVGDVMLDATLYFSAKAERNATILSDLKLHTNEYVLATVHRAENTNCPKKLKSIFEALGKLSTLTTVVLPLHPRTRQSLKAIQFDIEKSNIRFIDPVGYLDMLLLEKYAVTIITDSGGVQKEAYFHKTPCITLREETEWVELIEYGYNVLSKPESLIDNYHNARNVRFDDRATIYGKGDAAPKIVNELQRYLGRA